MFIKYYYQFFMDKIIEHHILRFREEGRRNEWIEMYIIKHFSDQNSELVREIIQREFQADFRKNIIDRDKKCIITGYDPLECEAAHIIPYAECKTFDISNGILLNRCLHKLFDEYLFSINPDTNRIVVKKGINNLSICSYNNKFINIPPECKTNIARHYNKFSALPQTYLSPS